MENEIKKSKKACLKKPWLPPRKKIKLELVEIVEKQFWP
jgi:hypothetical protein